MNISSRLVDANLTQRGLHALKWRYVGAAVQILSSFTVAIVLARLLSPKDFGIVGMALIIFGIGKLVGDLGFGVPIIQRPNLTQDHMRAAFSGNVVMGILLFSGLWFLAPMISRVFIQDELTIVLRVIGVSFILYGMGAAPVYFLRRELQFRTLAGIEAASYVVGYGGIGIALALLGHEFWSLVAAHIVQLLCLAVLAIYLTKLPLWPNFGFREYSDLFRIGYAEVLRNVTNYVAENLDLFVIATGFGASALGLYKRASYLIRKPLFHFASALGSVMFPLYAMIQGDVPRLGRAHLKVISLTAVVTMPVMFTMAAAPEIVIVGLFGEQWKAAAPVLQILCITAPFLAIVRVLTSLNHARGYVFSEWWRQLIYLVIMGVALWVLFPLGLQGVAWAVALSTFSRYLLLTQLSVRLTGMTWGQYVSAHVPGCLLGITVSASVYTAAEVLATYHVSYVLQLFMIVAVSIFTLSASLLLFPGSWFGDLYPWLHERLGATVPYWLRKILAVKVPESGMAKANDGRVVTAKKVI